MMIKHLSLLCPEWQCCRSPKVHASALWMAELLFKDEQFLHIEAPDEETLRISDGVFGLASIAPRFKLTLHELSTRKPTHLSMIGGTCGTETAPISYLNNLYCGDLAVIWFDAHADLNTPESSPSADFHGMVLRTLLGEGPRALREQLVRPLNPDQVFLVGTRDLDEPERQYIAAANIHVMPDLTEASTRDLLVSIAQAGFRHIYVHIDVDVINPNSFSDSLMPTAGGPSIDTLAKCVNALKSSFDVVGISIVEYCGNSNESRAQLQPLFRSAS
jgi:arginase